MEKTLNDLRNRAQQIKAETVDKAITAERMGSLLEDMIDTIPNSCVLNIDDTVTQEGINPVSSKGIYKELENLGTDINQMTELNVPSVDENGNAPRDYVAGDIFYVDDNSTTSGKMDRRKYWISFWGGNEGDKVEDSLRFQSTYSSAEAARLSDAFKQTPAIRCDLVQELSETQLELAQANLGIRDSISKIESITVASAQDIRNLWASNPISEQEQQQVADGEITDAGETTTDNQVEH